MRTLIMMVVVVEALLAPTSALPPRNLTKPDVNPGCDKECEEPWVVVTAGMAGNSTLFHLWGAKDALSFVMVAGSGEPEITTDWDALRNRSAGSITFSNKPFHVFGFVIPSLILYNDVHDAGAYQYQNDSVKVPVSDFTWSVKMQPNSTREEAVLLQTTHYRGQSLPNNTRMLIQVAAYGEDGRSTVLPHLLRTPDSAQLDLILNNLNLNITNETQGWEEARWAMDVVIFSSEHKTNEDEEEAGIEFFTQKSLDDEHTPGVFNLDQITTAGARAGAKAGGYLQWRPVSYLTSERDINEATIPNINTSFSELTNLNDPLKASLAFAVLGENLTLPGATVTTVISFGQPKDEFYHAYNYTTWTVALGEGQPPEETFSTLILVIISIGVAIPCVMLLGGCVALGIRRCRRRSATTLLINHD